VGVGGNKFERFGVADVPVPRVVQAQPTAVDAHLGGGCLTLVHHGEEQFWPAGGAGRAGPAGDGDAGGG